MAAFIYETLVVTDGWSIGSRLKGTEMAEESDVDVMARSLLSAASVASVVVLVGK